MFFPFKTLFIELMVIENHPLLLIAQVARICICVKPKLMVHVFMWILQNPSKQAQILNEIVKFMRRVLYT